LVGPKRLQPIRKATKCLWVWHIPKLEGVRGIKVCNEKERNQGTIYQNYLSGESKDGL